MSYERDFRREREGANGGPTTFFRNIERTFTGLNEKLEKPVLDHLRNVYATVAVGIGAAAVGAAIHIFTNLLRANFFLSLVSIFLMFKLMSTPNSYENQKQRLGMFIGFCAISGVSLGPLLERVMVIDPSVVTTALMSTAVVFGSFTLAALHSPTTKFIHLGGILASSSLILLISMFFAPHWFILWAGLAISVGFVLYDTQMIVEKSRRGDTDYVWHSVELFLDFVNLFRYIVILLADKKRNENDNRRKRN